MITARAAAAVLFSTLGPLFTLSCGQKVLLGGTEPPPPVPDPACQGAPCGATCVIDPCRGATAECLAIAIMGYCDPGTAICVDSPPPCPPPPPPPCLGAPCGAPCEPVCPDGDPCPLPPGPFTCDGMGSCVPGAIDCPCDQPGCPVYEPCLGLPCGAPCDPCPPMGPACPPPGAPTVCDTMGACVPAMGPVCPPPPFNPCLSKLCGDPCQLCPPNDPSCVEPPGPKTCDDIGQCILGMITCAEPGDAGAAEGGMGGP